MGGLNSNVPVHCTTPFRLSAATGIRSHIGNAFSGHEVARRSRAEPEKEFFPNVPELRCGRVFRRRSEASTTSRIPLRVSEYNYSFCCSVRKIVVYFRVSLTVRYATPLPEKGLGQPLLLHKSEKKKFIFMQVFL